MTVPAALSVVPYDESYAAGQSALVRRFTAEPRRTNPVHLRWKYRGPATGPVNHLLLAVTDDAVVGQLGLTSVTLRTVQGEVPGFWIGDVALHPDLRAAELVGALLSAVGTGVLLAAPGTLPENGADGFRPCASSHIGELDVRGNVRSPRAVWRLRRSAETAEAAVCAWEDVADLISKADARLPSPHQIHDHAVLTWRCGGLDGWRRPDGGVRTPDGAFALYRIHGPDLDVLHWGAGTDAPRAAAALTAVVARLRYVAAAHGLARIRVHLHDETHRAVLGRLGVRFRPDTVLVRLPVGVPPWTTYTRTGLDGAEGL